MIHTAIDLNFADEVSSRYLYGLAPLLPAEMTLLQQEQEEQSESPAPKYETYLENITQITQNTEENLILNLKVDFHFLQKMFTKTLAPVIVPKQLQKQFIENPKAALKKQLAAPEIVQQIQQVQTNLLPLQNESLQKKNVQPEIAQQRPEESRPAETILKNENKVSNVEKTVLKTEKEALENEQKPKEKPNRKKSEEISADKKNTANIKQTIQTAERKDRRETARGTRPFPQASEQTENKQGNIKEKKLFVPVEKVFAKESQIESQTDTIIRQGQESTVVAQSVLKTEPGQTDRLEIQNREYNNFYPIEKVLAKENQITKEKQLTKDDSEKKEAQKKEAAQKLEQAAEKIVLENKKNKAAVEKKEQSISLKINESRQMQQFAQRWAERQKPMLEKAAAGKQGQAFYPFVRAAMMHRHLEENENSPASALAQLQMMDHRKTAHSTYSKAEIAQKLKQKDYKPEEKNEIKKQVETIHHLDQLLKWDTRILDAAGKPKYITKVAQEISREGIKPMQLRYPEGQTTGQMQPDEKQFTQQARQLLKTAEMHHAAHSPSVETDLQPNIIYRNGVKAAEQKDFYPAGNLPQSVQSDAGRRLAAEPAVLLQKNLQMQTFDAAQEKPASPFRQDAQQIRSVPPLNIIYRREPVAEKKEQEPEEFNDIQTIRTVVKQTAEEKHETVRAINASAPIMNQSVQQITQQTAAPTVQQVNQIADQVYNILERRLRFENLRKGAF